MSNPLLGGSTIIESISLKESILSSTFPSKKEILEIWFNSLQILAETIEDGSTSTPITWSTYLEISIPIVPVPQYKSKTFW